MKYQLNASGEELAKKAADGKPKDAEPVGGSETDEWSLIGGIIIDAFQEEIDAGELLRRHIDDNGSHYPTLSIGPEVVPGARPTDARLLAPPDSDLYKEAIANPQTEEQILRALYCMAELRPPISYE